MRNKPKQPTGIIIAGIIATLILAGIAVVIIYFINRNPVVTPTEEAASCCTCDWTLKQARSTATRVTTAVGNVNGGICEFPDLAPFMGNYNIAGCVSVPVTQVFSDLPPSLSEEDQIVAKESRNTCTGGCTFFTSNPLLPPTKITGENNEVTFTAYFELRYAVEPHTEYSTAEMIITYPNDSNSPAPIEATSLELVKTRNEGDNTGTGESLPLKIYRATFDTTWDTVLNPDVPGIYKVSFRAQDNSPEGVWTSAGTCKRDFEVVSDIPEGNYCYSLDAVPVDGNSPLDVTLSVDAGVPTDDPTAVYQWELDLNCNGEIDEGTGETAERFTTPTDTNSITRTYTLVEGAEDADCSADVSVLLKDGQETLDNLTPGSCSSSVAISKISAGEACGNGTCDELETCDTNGNISCPTGSPLDTGYVCTLDCTYCGDGNLDSTETCDPGATAGQEGYDPNCRDDCTAPEVTENCGNGTLDPGEDCDPAIPAGQPGYNINCQTNCRVSGNLPNCGNGILNPGEECDPAIPAGQTGYNADCQSNCQIGTQPPPPSNELTIVQQVSQCVELVSPKNITPITITITNGTASDYGINAISNTLPQGFAYVSGSSVVDGTANTSDAGVILEMSGSSQLITWNNNDAGWTLGTGKTITIAFKALASSSATIGSHENTVTVTPSDNDPIPSVSSITVAQVCAQPNTGIFNRNVVIILAGVLLLFTSGVAYYSGFGTTEVAKLIQKGTYSSRLLFLRLTRPQKYSEERIEESALKNIKRKTDVSTRPSNKGQK